MVNVLKSLTSSNKMFVIRAGTHKMPVRITNREDPDQTAFSEMMHILKFNIIYVSL